VNLENWSNLSPKGAESLICQDAFYVGLDPATVLRKLSLKIDVTKPFYVNHLSQEPDPNKDPASKG
jgi:hypothetical protein